MCGNISASAVTDIYYIAHRQFKDKATVKELLNRLLMVISVAAVSEREIISALELVWSDFNDSVQYSVALLNEMDRLALNQKFMNGVGNNQFAPNANLSRAMLAQILYSKEGSPATYGSNTFTDVQYGASCGKSHSCGSGKNAEKLYGHCHEMTKRAWSATN